MKTKFNVGDLYKITFKDHSCGMKGSVLCEVVGWIEENSKDEVVITSWQILTKDKELRENNLELTTVVKSCIVKIRKL